MLAKLISSDLPTSASRGGGIRGLSHHTWVKKVVSANVLLSDLQCKMFSVFKTFIKTLPKKACSFFNH